jgi:hypothetical protein
MATKTARTRHAGKTNRVRKGHQSNITSKITRATSSRDRYYRNLAISCPVSDEAYLRDEAILAEVMSEFSFEERRAIDRYDLMSIAISAGSPHFRAEILPLLGKAMQRRARRLHKLLNDIRGFFELRLQSYYPDLSSSERERAINHVVTSAQANYTGEVEDEAVMVWTAEKMGQTVTFIRAIRAYENGASQTFAELYKRRRALLGGIKDVLVECKDLGVDLGQDGKIGDTVSEIEQTAWAYIWDNIFDWVDPDKSKAAVTTRLYGLGYKTARIWRTARLRSRERAEWIAYLVDHHGLSEKDVPEDELRQAA